MIGHVGHALRALKKMVRKRPFLILFLLITGMFAGFLAGAYVQATGQFDVLQVMAGLE